MDEIAGNTIVLRQINTNMVKAELKEQRTGTKFSLSTATGLSIATVGTILAALIQSGEVLEVEPTESSGGRRARQFEFNPRHTLIALLIVSHRDGAALLSYTVADLYRKAIEQSTMQIAADCIESMTVQLKDLFTRYSQIKVIGIGLPAPVRDGIPFVSDEFPELLDFPLKSYFEDLFEVPVVVENDVNAASVGYFEKNISDARVSMAYLYLSQESCMGGAMIINGQLISGFSSFAGEVSYLPIGGTTLDDPLIVPQTLARIIACIACIINPQTVVLTSLDPALLEHIYTICADFIPKNSIPTLIISNDFEGDYLAGLTHCALSKLDFSVKLITH